MSAPLPTVESPATGLRWYRITVKLPHPYEVGRILSEHHFVQARSPKEAMTRMPLHLRSSASVAPYQVVEPDTPDHSTKAYRAMLWTGRVMRAAGRWAVNKDAKALD
ncbi:hypothetical protein [Amycolatopsis azurea]|uniref:Uncharacterized protein n=1 Tax=Amycolatopsis azurea DSM 43854 TaxID=1238180 RepID=M2NKU2_9PSEU|nr:hypothetical protein [Amycolatopsis azurea]EMD22779.1 hypothetical protein C791_8003 [Amycolatopsis azurea DSM 43854]OOC01024.1 hypothetical protein B0293_40205 [Amycolatopsis azurea DSM 43854]